ncbi:MAG: nitroreductase family protein [Candidatus Altiarchaeota archaeon]|nr:nitroreductase family protein [Candidatus Altiarchaeota archaeon]
MDVRKAIEERRSVREFTSDNVPDKDVRSILDAGRWAPSGLNNQPWKFKIIRDDETKRQLAGCTHYGGIIKSAPVSIAVLLDNTTGYDRTKDLQAVGACIQNMLLSAHSLGMGAVWLGEILNKRKEAENILGVRADCELMAVVAVGRPVKKKRASNRKSLEDLILY